MIVTCQPGYVVDVGGRSPVSRAEIRLGLRSLLAEGTLATDRVLAPRPVAREAFLLHKQLDGIFD